MTVDNNNTFDNNGHGNDFIADVSHCYDCDKLYNDIDREHGMCHKCWQTIIEK